MSDAQSSKDVPRQQSVPGWVALLALPLHILMICFWMIVGTAILKLISLTGIEFLFIAGWIVGALGIIPLSIWSTLRILRHLNLQDGNRV